MKAATKRKGLRLAVLTRYPRSESVRRLTEAARARGHRVRIFDPTRFAIHVENDHPALYYADDLISKVDAVVPRFGSAINFFGTAVVRQFERMGVFTANSALAISVARDKLRAMQALSRHNVAIPRTAFAKDRSTVLPTIERVGGAPVVLKLLEGTQGIGVMLAEDIKTAQAIIDGMQAANQNVLVQTYVRESRGRDIRAFVVGGQVIAAMRRIGAPGDFRSNLHRGGTAERVEIDPTYEHVAIRATQVIGLNIAGVDILESDQGPMVIEVNATPGIAGIEETTKVDVSGAIVEFIEREIKLPEVDIRQRLTVKPGYAVVELRVSAESELAGLTMADSRLGDRDVVVLTITRSGQNIPIPRADERIEVGDLLLCFGQAATLKALLPASKGH